MDVLMRSHFPEHPSPNPNPLTGLPTVRSSDHPTPPRSLEEGEVYVIYHRASGRAPEISKIAGYELENFQSKPSLDVPSHASRFPDMPPWFPFESREDFEQAEYWVDRGYSSKDITAEIKLHRKHAQKQGVQPFYSFSSARNMHQTLANARAIANISEVRKTCSALSGSFIPIT